MPTPAPLIQNPGKHSVADGPLVLSATWKDSMGNVIHDPWWDKEEAGKALDAGRQVLRMFVKDRPWSEAKKYLEDNVFKFAPGAAEEKSGGSLEKFAKNPSHARPLPQRPFRPLGM